MLFIFFMHSFRNVIELETWRRRTICVVFVERGDLLKAEKCLAEVHKMAPKGEYTLNHLYIVRAKIKEYIDKRQAAQGQAAASQGQQGQ